MNEAENTVEETEESSPAEEQEQELTVPKHRLDALSEQVRRLKEENAMKDRAISDLAQSRQPQRPQGEDEEEAELENLGLSKEVTRQLRKVFDKKLGQAIQQVGGHLSTINMNVDETRFLQKHGVDKEVYLEKIRETRRQHAAQNSFLSIENAYKLIKFDEGERKAKAPKAKVEAQKTVVVEEKAPEKKPVVSTSAGKSIEDWENELDEQIKSGGGRI